MFMWQSGSTIDSLAALVRQFNRFLKAETQEQPAPANLRGQPGRTSPQSRPQARPASPEPRK